MAFATTNPDLHNSGSSYKLTGSWTGTAGDASGTVTGSGFCTGAVFLTNRTGSPDQTVPVQIDNTSGTWTVTVGSRGTVTIGTYEINYK